MTNCRMDAMLLGRLKEVCNRGTVTRAAALANTKAELSQHACDGRMEPYSSGDISNVLLGQGSQWHESLALLVLHLQMPES